MGDDIRQQWRELVRRHMLHPTAPAMASVWAPELETVPRSRLREMQGERLAAAYRLLWECSTWYRRKFERAGLSAASVQGIDDLTRIPVTRPDEWLDDQQANPPWGTFSPLRDEDWLSRGWMLFTTSGTTAGLPRSFRHTTHDRDLWAWVGARALYAMGVRAGDVAVNCFGYGTSVAFWGLHHALNLMGVPVIPGGAANTERRARFIALYKPTVLLATPTYALHLGRVMQDVIGPPAESSVRLVVVAGEPGACVPETRRRIQQLWGATVHDDFGCTEVAMPPLGYTCQAQAESDEPMSPHLMEDAFIAEVVDPDTLEPVPEGRRGLLVVSNLFSEAQPIPRYLMGDWTSITTEPCRCGRTHARAVGGLHGRTHGRLKIRGLAFFPAAIEDAIRGEPAVGDEFTVDISNEGDSDRVLVTAEVATPIPKADLGEVADQIAQSLRGKLGVSVVVTLVPYNSLPRTNEKARRIRDLRGAPA